MKRLFSIFISVLLSLFAGVNYQQQDEAVFEDDSYYKIQNEDDFNYRNAYGGGNITTGGDGCHPRKRNGNARIVKNGGTVSDAQVGANMYWFVENEIVSVGDLSDDSTYTVESNASLIAPVECEILTSNKTCEDNTIVLSCQIGSDSYTIKIANLERWWCCYGRTTDAAPGEIPVWEHTCPDPKGSHFAAGNIIGKAIAGTTVITITKSGSSGDSVTIRKFYQGN